MESTTSRFLFDSVGSAALGLMTVLVHARKTGDTYRFYGLNVNSIVQSGLVLEGEIDEVVTLLEAVPGATRHDE